jgi:hypothetical protein
LRTDTLNFADLERTDVAPARKSMPRWCWNWEISWFPGVKLAGNAKAIVSLINGDVTATNGPTEQQAENPS